LNGNHLDKVEVHRAFYCLSREIGLRAVGASRGDFGILEIYLPNGRGPRLHDFRHRFAIATLLR
jgi:hypothetical protein